MPEPKDKLQLDDNDKLVFADESDDELVFADESDDKLIFADESDDELVFADETKEKPVLADKTPTKREEPKTWKIMIVDDEETVHEMTERVLRRFSFENRSVCFLKAYSGEEAKHLICDHPDIALILLDVVMETDHAGLEVVRYIREELRNDIVQIILRTGQPGQAPEHDVIVGYSINDYKTKTELTAQKLFTTVATSLRAYRLTENLREEIAERRKAELELCELNEELEDRVKERTAELARANAEILSLNEQLRAENLHMKAELDVARRLQKMVLPTVKEIGEIKDVEIACFMEPADEVGGDYYDILSHNGSLKIGIGDVTGHGLESGVLMLMVQTVVRTLLTSGETNPKRFLDVLNRTIYDNVHRMGIDKTLTLALLDYEKGRFKVSGYHEHVIIVRQGGKVSLMETEGIWVAAEQDITPYIPEKELNITLQPGDGVVLYSDGITEAFAEGAEPSPENLYGLERLCNVISRNWDKSSEEIKQAVIDDVRRHVGKKSIMHDDLTLVVLKQR